MRTRATCRDLSACLLAVPLLLAGCDEGMAVEDAPAPVAAQPAAEPEPDRAGTAPSHRTGSALGGAKRSAVRTRDAVEDRQRQMEEQIKEMEGDG